MNRYRVRKRDLEAKFTRALSADSIVAERGNIWEGTYVYVVTAKDELDAWLQVKKYLEAKK